MAVNARPGPRLLAVALLATSTVLPTLAAPIAAAKPCAGTEVIFARGSDEPPGVGKVGQAFVDALRAAHTDQSIAVYPVNYAAASALSSGIDFDRSVIAGIRDEVSHIEWTALDCPDTQIVLGGYSQGAAVTGYTTSPSVPTGVPAELVPDLPRPMPDVVADHVAAVILFGKPSARFIRRYDAPPVTVGPLYAAKTREYCARNDTVCDGGDGLPLGHTDYPTNGMPAEAAAFAARRLEATSAPPVIFHGWHGQ
ncbi:cutinase family protein [Mycobacterium talmoniae]|uniref:Cutinase n=1 Tax=Mycobacterium talmoniae TaxID=1858794 RepID=A0A1S1N1V6_9MYCO|nr:cutinase family protein [Mycobacterium talmoniae]OHU93339.1 cutinase family protein [Mycobacterium talmoniae]